MRSQARIFESHKLLIPPMAFSDSDFIAANSLFISSSFPMLSNVELSLAMKLKVMGMCVFEMG